MEKRRSSDATHRKHNRIIRRHKGKQDADGNNDRGEQDRKIWGISQIPDLRKKRRILADWRLGFVKE
jgi:hypothetical protein